MSVLTAPFGTSTTISIHARRHRITSDESGMTLVELMIVLAIVGLAAGMAGVYISAGDTQLRSTLRNLQFDLEQAKQEAVLRNADVSVDFPDDLPAWDYNGDGVVNEKDACYIVYVNRDNTAGFDPDNADPDTRDIKIKAGLLAHSTQFAQSQRLSFSPMGSSNPGTITLTAPVRDDVCATKCLATSCSLTINHVGRIQMGEKQTQCVDCAQCYACQ